MAGTVCRVDQVIFEASGAVEVRYTFGQDPLPVGWQGTGFRLPGGVAELNQYIDGFLPTLTADTMLPYLLARWRAQDPVFGQVNKIIGNTLSVDFGAPPGLVLRLN